MPRFEILTELLGPFWKPDSQEYCWQPCEREEKNVKENKITIITDYDLHSIHISQAFVEMHETNKLIGN